MVEWRVGWMDKMFFKNRFFVCYFKGPSRDGHWKLAKAINAMMLSVGLLYNPHDLYLSLSNKPYTIQYKEREREVMEVRKRGREVMEVRKRGREVMEVRERGREVMEVREREGQNVSYLLLHSRFFILHSPVVFCSSCKMFMFSFSRRFSLLAASGCVTNKWNRGHVKYKARYEFLGSDDFSSVDNKNDPKS